MENELLEHVMAERQPQDATRGYGHVRSERAWGQRPVMHAMASSSSDLSSVVASDARPPDEAAAEGLARVLDALRKGSLRGTGRALILDGATERFHVDFVTQRVFYRGGESLDDRMLGRRLLAMSAGVRLLDDPTGTVFAKPDGARGQALTSMIWDAALDLDEEQRDSAIDENTVVRLLRWPGFHLLAHRHDHFRLCSLMLRRPSSAHECVELLDIDVEQTMAFARAAYCTGCAELQPGVPVEPNVKAGWRQSGSRLVDWWRSVRDMQRNAS